MSAYDSRHEESRLSCTPKSKFLILEYEEVSNIYEETIKAALQTLANFVRCKGQQFWRLAKKGHLNNTALLLTPCNDHD